MTKAELIDRIAAANPKLSRRGTAALVEALFDEIKSSIRREGRFVVPGFGAFAVKERRGRAGVNPQTGARMEIPATRTVTFKPAPDLKRAVEPRATGRRAGRRAVVPSPAPVPVAVAGPAPHASNDEPRLAAAT